MTARDASMVGAGYLVGALIATEGTHAYHGEDPELERQPTRRRPARRHHPALSAVPRLLT